MQNSENLVTEYPQSKNKEIRNFLNQTFSKTEIQEIYFDLGLDIENFPDKKNLLIIELINWLRRKNRFHSLNKWLAEENYPSLDQLLNHSKQSKAYTNPNQFALLPKIDLHRHLEGSLRIDTLAEIANSFDLDFPKNSEALSSLLHPKGNKLSPAQFLSKFGLLRSFYQSPEIIRRVVYEAIADAAADNIKYLELRFNPQALAAQKGFPLPEVTDWVVESAKEAATNFGITVNLILTLVRNDPSFHFETAIRLATKRRNEGLVGLDLAGSEKNYARSDFAGSFREAKQEGLNITIHAGEWENADSIRHAIVNLNADRIGQGVTAINNNYVLALILERQIPLEMCLTSNLRTTSITSIREHPLKKLFSQGVKVTLNTDDPSMFYTTMTNEFFAASSGLDMDLLILYMLTINSLDAAFISQKKRNKLKSQIQREWAQISEKSVQ